MGRFIFKPRFSYFEVAGISLAYALIESRENWLGALCVLVVCALASALAEENFA